MTESRPADEAKPYRQAVGGRIRDLRLAKNWSQLELASRADLHRPYLTGVETGTRNPSLNTLIRIANALHVPLVELFR